jgi:hypothetical protein
MDGKLRHTGTEDRPAFDIELVQTLSTEPRRMTLRYKVFRVDRGQNARSRFYPEDGAVATYQSTHGGAGEWYCEGWYFRTDSTAHSAVEEAIPRPRTKCETRWRDGRWETLKRGRWQ